ncbi:small GTP-binding protein, putative [Trichomonas vaginalis G3]|uniref:Small GTP-binding protein, putative n=2 Tax=Trichomonas vaginalis TaxID=5722 RepID=A0A8U0WP58_TRIV3|nr:small Rab GTPase Rab6a [Trichomonas vaginalis G3]AAZ73169.1 small Rab GTPase Rab6a [Trichomonas vaginalis]EAX86757.1 small GTP-binding protein, putative [Trichomonas vaginalis G3]KAI5494652.1 small Rab GTPase Rab6a [Trichomonas vaginalis G3]|eukprot:XP_001299687.1 small GTP-binding protein [Trichomonas vaginalis G3]
MTTINHKVVLVGDSSVGKTSIINQFIYESISDEHQATVGIDFFSKQIEVDGKVVKMQIWDTAGQEKFSSLIPSYIRDSTVAVFVYDITSEESFDHLERWTKLVSDIANPSLVFVGNKTDLSDARQVPIERLQNYSEEKKGKFIEVSAKAPTNIKELFQMIAEIPPVDLPEPAKETTNVKAPANLNANSNNNAKSGGCC